MMRRWTAVLGLSLMWPGVAQAQELVEAMPPIRDAADLQATARDASLVATSLLPAVLEWAPDEAIGEELWRLLWRCSALLTRIEEAAGDDRAAVRKARDEYREVARLMARARGVAMDALRKYPDARLTQSSRAVDEAAAEALMQHIRRLDMYYFGNPSPEPSGVAR